MPATYTVEEDWTARKISEDDQGVITGTRSFFVSASNIPQTEATEADVEAALPIVKYESWPSARYRRALARTISIERHNSPAEFKVDIGYSSAPMKAPNGGPPAAVNPAGSPQKPTKEQNNSTPANQRLPQFTFRRKEVLAPAERDAAQNLILNSAGDAIEGLMVHRDRLEVGIKYWSIDLTLAHILDFWNVTNADVWQGFPVNTLLVTEFDFQSVYESMDVPGGTEPFTAMLYEVNLRLEYNPDTWKLQLLDAGTRQLVGGRKVPCRNADGSEVDKPVPLDAFGVQLSPTGLPRYINQPNFVQLYRSKNFNTTTSGTPPVVTYQGLIL